MLFEKHPGLEENLRRCYPGRAVTMAVRDGAGRLASAEQWLATLRQAALVITDSFHATVFAIVFRRPFICLPHLSAHGEERLTALLSGLGLSERWRTAPSQLRAADVRDDISWDEVHRRLSDERERGRAYLREVLALPPTDKAPFVHAPALQAVRLGFEEEYERWQTAVSAVPSVPPPTALPPSRQMSARLLSELSRLAGECGAQSWRGWGREARRAGALLPAALRHSSAAEDAAGPAELALVCGALEYADDPAALAGEITAAKPRLILVTYPERSLYPQPEARRAAGFVNALSKDDLIALFTARDYMVSRYELRPEWGAVVLELRACACHSVQHHALCCGCTACVRHCPKDAITIRPDVHGFFRAMVDPQRCELCGRCGRACPVIHPRFVTDPHPPCLAFESAPQLAALSSTAGGFQILARHFLRQGGLVAGAAWVADEHGGQTAVHHVLIEREEDLPALLKSKYVQSELGGICAQVGAALKAGRQVLFSGVPCQVAGLYATLGRKHPGLYTLEVLCNHVPSQRAFQNYLAERYGAGQVLSYDFRARAPHLPTTQNTAVTLRSGERLLYAKGREPFFALFLNHVMMGEFCENCRFAGPQRQADLTLGDFWGLERHVQGFQGRGHSGAALVNTERGRALLDIIAAQASRVRPVDAALLWQHNRTPEKNRAHPRRTQLREAMEEGRGLLAAALSLQLLPAPEPLLLMHRQIPPDAPPSPAAAGAAEHSGTVPAAIRDAHVSSASGAVLLERARQLLAEGRGEAELSVCLRRLYRLQTTLDCMQLAQLGRTCLQSAAAQDPQLAQVASALAALAPVP